MKMIDSFQAQIKQADDSIKALIEDLIQAHNAEDQAEMKRILGKIQECIHADKPLTFIDAATWLQSEPPKPDQVLKDTFDTGDKIAVIASSKLWKTMFAIQMALSIATGRPFLSWNIPKPRRMCLVQFEVTKDHYHRRVRRLCHALKISPEDLGDRLLILNARGLGIRGPEGVEQIRQALTDFQPEVIMFDPLYKLTTGAENNAEDMKIILNAFDKFAEETGAAVLYVHHDAKGSPGDRQITDRGAGSGVLGRDYDACFTLTAHASDPDAIVVETVLRNYRQQEAVTARFVEDEWTGGYKFEYRPDIIAAKKTSANAKQAPTLDTYLPAALEILTPGKMMDITLFKAELKKEAGISDNKVKAFIAWATAGGSPRLETKQEFGRGRNKKWIGQKGAFDKA